MGHVVFFTQYQHNPFSGF